MEEMVLFVVFRLSCMGIILLMLFSMQRNRNNRKKSFLFYRMLLISLPLTAWNLLWYLFSSALIPGGMEAANVILAIYYVNLITELFLIMIYCRCYVRLLPSRKGILSAILYSIPSLLILLTAVFDREQTFTMVELLFGAAFIYNSILNQLISLDPLTRLNNRNEFRSYLRAKMNMPGRNRLSLLMMDMNGFKYINDTYGHLEGDAALKRVAMCLKKACADIPGRPFIARYGGDEFIVVAETDNDFEVERICDGIHMMLALENHKAKAPYQLTVSIGTARCNGGTRSIYDLIEKADRELYQKKQKRKRITA